MAVPRTAEKSFEVFLKQLADGEGPGRFDTYYAGGVDGFERPLDGPGTHAVGGGAVIVDYELRRVQPVMANHGVGYYGRFFNEAGTRLRVGPAPIDPRVPAAGGWAGTRDAAAWDLYRATEIAFAHAGFLSTAQVPAPPVGAPELDMRLNAPPAPKPAPPVVDPWTGVPGAKSGAPAKVAHSILQTVSQPQEDR